MSVVRPAETPALVPRDRLVRVLGVSSLAGPFVLAVLGLRNARGLAAAT